MHIYTVVRSDTTGVPSTGSPTRQYQAENPIEAGRLYAAAEGLPNPVLHTFILVTGAGVYTFKPTAPQGSRVSVRVSR